MKFNLDNYSEADVLTTTEEQELTLSKDSASIIFQMFSKNIYSNPIGSVVREITSNCFDSHIEAGVNFPVLIKKFKDSQTETQYISFIDYGVGMSPQRIKEVFSVYFTSTKRADNNQIGGFGLGSKSVLAYKRSTGQGEGEYDNSYNIITVYNGQKYIYLIHEGKKCPYITLLHQESVDENNGTEIRIPVLDKDITTFAKEMVRQLYYFENIIFEGFEDGYYCDTLTNEYQIVRGKSFLFRGSDYSDVMHICLGRVAYPIDYTVLGLNSNDYRMPIAIKLEVGDINVVVSRESVDYSESTIKMLRKKLIITKAEITEMLVKQYSNITTLEDYFKVKYNFGVLCFGNGKTVNVGKLVEFKDLDFSDFKYSFMKMPNDKQLFKFFFNTKSYGAKSKSRYGAKTEFDGGYVELLDSTKMDNPNILYVEDEFNRKVVKQAYLKNKFNCYHIISKRNLLDSYFRAEISELFNVHITETIDATGNVLPYIQSLIEMQDEYFEIIKRVASNYDKLEVPEDFIVNRKRSSLITKEMRNISIPVKFMGGNSKKRIKLDTLFNYNMPIFYCTLENEKELQKAYNIYCVLFDNNSPVNYVDYNGELCNRSKYYNKNKNKKSIMFIMIANNNLKYMKYCKKAYKASDFYWKLLRRKESAIINYFQTKDIVEQWNCINNLYKSEVFSKVNGKWAKKSKEITEYVINLPVSNDSELKYYKNDLSNYFDLNVQKTYEQKRIEKMIDEFKELNKQNLNTLHFIDIPYDLKNTDKLFFEILKKVLVF